jgi:hypothetical protein
MTTFEQKSTTVVVPITPQKDKKSDIQQGRSKKSEETYKPRID